MYEINHRLSLKMFQQNHSFTFIEDKETILALTNELLDSPFGWRLPPSWYMRTSPRTNISTPVTGKTRCWTRGTSLSTKVPLPMRRS